MSPLTVTDAVLGRLSPAAKVIVVGATATKSLPAVAVPLAVAHRDDEVPAVAPVRVTVNVASFVPELPLVEHGDVVDGPGEGGRRW